MWRKSNASDSAPTGKATSSISPSLFSFAGLWGNNGARHFIPTYPRCAIVIDGSRRCFPSDMLARIDRLGYDFQQFEGVEITPIFFTFDAETTSGGPLQKTKVDGGDLEREGCRADPAYSRYVERGCEQSKRRLASELSIALELANAYLVPCIKKARLKIGQAPARQYAYYQTHCRFAEKSRFTFE